MNTYLAMDFGAESGRGILVSLDGKKIAMKEIYRFPNRPVALGGTLYWDFPYLFAEILETLRLCAHQAIPIESIGVDTWGVDFGLLGPDEQLLSLPVHYRDERTDNIHDYSNPVMPTEEIFIETATEPWAISSLFQLLAMQKKKSPILSVAGTFLNMPDLFNFFLSGVKTSERSIVSTSNLMATDGRWSRRIIERFGLPEIFPSLTEPGTVLGPLSKPISEKLGLKDLPVVATCGHDTAAVAAAVPATGDNWAFLSCGTWSILGKLCEKPINTPDALKKGFSNEYTLGSWFLCKNILGLWLVQELKRKWDIPGDPWDYGRITDEAAKAQSAGLVNVSDSSLMTPVDMEQALLELLAKLGQPKPASRGRLVRCVLESLALEYALRLEMLGELTNRQTDSVFMVGGGVANKLLCRLTANACGVPVHAGADQCTAIGNALTQAVALKTLDSPEHIRRIMRNSFSLTTYTPEDKNIWKERLKQYRLLIHS